MKKHRKKDKPKLTTGNKVLIGLLIFFGIIAVVSIISMMRDSASFSTEQYKKSNFVPGQISTDQNTKKESSCRTIQEPYEVQVPYTDNEYYTEREPYTDEECKQVNIIYSKENGKCLDMQNNVWSEDDPARYSCKINNLDDKGGLFELTFTFNTEDGDKITRVKNGYIYPQSDATFEATAMSRINSCACGVSKVPQKQVCSDVIKFEEVTKSRTVTKYRTETEYRTREVCN
jgi:hypothetical protein